MRATHRSSGPRLRNRRRRLRGRSSLLSGGGDRRSARTAGLAPGRRVCDLAAGTGKLTRLLAEAGADVIAVEPVPGMREELKAAVPSADVRDGVAEDIPLDDGMVDLVTIAQAFHWFRFDEAVAEIHRVLAPGGSVAILFNERDERVPWVKAWNKAIEWHSQRIAHYQDTDWTAVLTSGGFHDVGYHRVDMDAADDA